MSETRKATPPPALDPTSYRVWLAPWSTGRCSTGQSRSHGLWEGGFKPQEPRVQTNKLIPSSSCGISGFLKPNRRQCLVDSWAAPPDRLLSFLYSLALTAAETPPSPSLRLLAPGWGSPLTIPITDPGILLFLYPGSCCAL